ncbi:uncharacterized protein LOC119353296 [Triticum dicoccoides]|uniref:uncharacterized protein LOC119353296 n=1 Tax=Triticum dicoccoides TaxID=85692 RepID=UPI00189061FF|nr:uncharacterized protein LOC119353296 [Triticum dicoccoides]
MYLSSPRLGHDSDDDPRLDRDPSRRHLTVAILPVVGVLALAPGPILLDMNGVRTAATRGRQARDGRILPSPALRPALRQARPPRPGLLAVPPWGPPPPPLVLASAPCIDLLDREPWADWAAEEDLSDAAAAAAGLLPRGRRFGDRLAELVSAMETAQQAV